MFEINNKEDFYRLAALNFAGTAAMNKYTAAVHVEGTTDINFWKNIFNHFYPDGKFYFIAYSKTFNPKNHNSTASGSTHCLNYKPYLNKKFFICIDSDYRYLQEEPYMNIQNYIFQTYTYAIENHYCYAAKLNKAIEIASGLKNDFFDFEVFLRKYSNIIYEIFIWHQYLLHKQIEIDSLSIIPFNNMITIRGKIAGWQVDDNGQKVLETIKERVDKELAKIKRRFPNIDIEKQKEYYKKFGLTKDNTYLFIRGHHLMSLISKIGDKCVEKLIFKRQKNTNDSNEIKLLHKRSRSFKSVIQKFISFDDYEAMNKIDSDIDYFFNH